MPNEGSGGAPRAGVRTLIRNARQLITLQGPGGPRCGTAMSAIGIIPNGALLIHDGLIEEVGPTRRIENLGAAKGAREIDAGGRIVVPAFVEPDAALGASGTDGKDEAARLSVSSSRNLEFRVFHAAVERARYGCIAIGSATPATEDLRAVVRLLKAQRRLQQRPLRIRPIVTWHGGSPDLLSAKWLPALRRQKLASTIDIAVDDADDPERLLAIRAAAGAASSAGFAVRFRSSRHLQPGTLMLAHAAGVVSIVSPIRTFHAFSRPLAKIGCVRVVPLAPGAGAGESVRQVREAIDAGAAVALTSERAADTAVAINPQFLIHVAVERYALTPAEALTALTWNAACALRMSPITGSLDSGRQADLVMLEVPDYRELARRPGNNDAVLVMRSGRPIWQKPALIPD